jgi:hypothetical protein
MYTDLVLCIPLSAINQNLDGKINHLYFTVSGEGPIKIIIT